jgi:hypothetical protein
MIQFHETGYGRKFLEGDFPRLVAAMERIADALTQPKPDTSPTKVLIQVEGGVVGNISANKDIEIVLADLDNIEEGDELEVLHPDTIFSNGEAYKLYEDTTDKNEQKVAKFLEVKKF